MAFHPIRILLAAAGAIWYSATHDPSHPPCPYCNEPLPEKPERTIHCESCGHRVHVRAGQHLTDYDTRAVDILKSLGQPYRSALVLPSMMWEDGRGHSLNDIARETLDVVIARTDSCAALRRLYYDRARIAAAEGRDPAAFLRESARAALLEWKRVLPRDATVVVSPRPGACDVCRAVGGRRLRLDAALAENVVPIAGCTMLRFEACRHPWCRCFYSRP